MKNTGANHSIYRVTIHAYPEPLVLLSAELHEARSDISHGLIRVSVNSPLSETHVGAGISFDWHDGAGVRYWHGMIISLWAYSAGCVELQIRSRLHRLTLQYQPKHFVNTDVISVLKALLLPLYEATHIMIEVTKTLPEQGLIFHQISDDYFLLERLLSEHGLYYYERHELDHACIIIGDAHQAKYRHSDTVIDTKNATSVYHWHQSPQQHVETFTVGAQVNDLITEHWSVVSITHYCDESEGVAMGAIIDARSRYRAHIVAQSIHETWITPVKQENNTASQLRLAKVHSFDQGQYQLILDHDKTNENPTPPIPSLTPYGGENFGLHWPLPDETQILIMTMNGNADKPIILGTLNRAVEKHHHQLKTAGGHALLFDDTPDKASIQLSSVGERCYLHMDARKEEELISLCNTAGGIDMHAGGSIQLTSGDGYSMESGTDAIISALKNIHITSDEADIVMNAGACHQFASGHDMTMDIGKNLILDIKGQYTMHVKEGYILDITEGDYKTNLNQGSMHWSVRDTVTITSQSGEIRVSCGEASITLRQSGDIAITGRSITLGAADIYAKKVSHLSHA